MLNRFETLTDEEIVKLSRDGDLMAEEYMLKKYAPMVRSEIRLLYLAGADSDDLMQEGMIGLIKAIREYDSKAGALFKTFATICVRNQVKTSITAASRKKHSMLNNAISLEGQTEYASDNLEDAILEEESKKEMYDIIDKVLSNYEKKVVELYLTGLSYADMANELDKPVKSINNALIRIKKKLIEKRVSTDN